VQALSTAILRALENQEFAFRLGKNARQHVARHFSADSMAQNYLWHFNQVLANHYGAHKSETALEVIPQ
jgi:glycosyltransferase involved in cell wall biosynthesis